MTNKKMNISLLVSLLLLVVLLVVSPTITEAFSSSYRYSTSSSTTSSAKKIKTFLASSTTNEATPSTKPKTIAVTGATGRTGRLVIQKLIESTNHNVVALVRDESKAQTLFVDGEAITDTDFGESTQISMKPFITPDNKDRLQIQKCDLLNKNQIDSIVESTGVDQLIWCATGFSSNPNASPLDRLSTLWNAVVKKGENTIDYVGLVSLAQAIEANSKKNVDEVTGPKIIMLSSAGVTRPSWTEEKKVKYAGCADIPIVRLNPFNILNIKATSEEKLRQCGVSYTVVRPTGLKDGNAWFYGSNARPIISQGDVAVGRIHRTDVASLLLSCIDSKDVIGKTWEVFSIGGYQPPSALEKLFASLKFDADIAANGGVEDGVLESTYFAMQQLLPGETQDAAALAMGQTYEELDEGKVGRLGVRGEEVFESVAPKPSPV